jgi:hypothetical protein
MVGVAGPSPQGGENSGPGATASGAPSAQDYINQANAAGAGSSSTSSGNPDTYLIYAGTTSVVTNQYGDVRVGHFNPRPAPQKNASEYAQFIISLQASNPALYKQYQQQLYKAGYYGSSKPIYGTYTGRDGQAIQQMLQDYEATDSARVSNGLGRLTPVDYLADTIKKGGSALANGGVTRQPLTIQYTDPETLKATLQSAAQDGLGRNLTDKELTTFVSKFHGQEAAAQTGAYNNDTSITPPDAGADAQALVTNQHGPEHDQKLAAGYLDSINQMLGVL